MNRAGHARAERFTRAQIPNIYALMDEFTVCGNYFSDYAGEGESTQRTSGERRNRQIKARQYTPCRKEPGDVGSPQTMIAS